ncbi:MAG TPA: signal recognition particle-docking protein FtsY [Cyanobacteria bacterium UBA11148]|nr:signal recognition particle-docking protein FtsY [Cyanobacteria bacterium UBA11148]
MVFNWFRRQNKNKDASAQETPAQTPQVEPEQKVTDQPSQEESPTVSDDYLNWAKAAYKNIQKQQQPSAEEATPTATEPTEIAQEEESAPELSPSPEVTEELTNIPTPTSVEIEESAIPDTQDIQETPALTTDVSEPDGITEIPVTLEAITQEDSAPRETIITQPEIETTAEVEEQITAEVINQTVETAEPESETPTEPQLAETPTTPELEIQTEAPVSDESSVPIWARKSDRQERLKRLEATAIETPEPEPLQVAQPQEAAATIGEDENVAGLDFDEEFLWSAKVLASQGRTPEDVSAEEISWLKRLRQGLGKTRRGLVNQLKAIVGQGPLNQDAVMEIEALLLQADVGVEATDYIINTLQAKMRQEVLPPEQAIAYLKQILRDLLDKPCTESYSTTFVPEKDTLNIWLMTGVNGVGKTTTIGKLAHLANKSGYLCLIGAADTFRAAAVEQVKIWGERSGTEVIANPGKNTDPAAVVFDAIAAAQARNVELLLVDTAGRLQNKKNLMEELAKIRRIVDKKAPNAKVESLLVLDATLGQNGLRQAQVFSEAAKLSGVVLTKLDGTAKGGVALAVVQQLGLPIRFIGAGEGIEDLRPFSSYEFVEALLSG